MCQQTPLSPSLAIAVVHVTAAIEPRFHARRVCFLGRVADFFREDHYQAFVTTRPGARAALQAFSKVKD